jgi:hypothetical protein
MPPLFSLERPAGKRAGDSGNSLPVLRKSGQVRDRLFCGRYLAESTLRSNELVCFSIDKLGASARFTRSLTCCTSKVAFGVPCLFDVLRQESRVTFW